MLAGAGVVEQLKKVVAVNGQGAGFQQAIAAEAGPVGATAMLFLVSSVSAERSYPKLQCVSSPLHQKLRLPT